MVEQNIQSLPIGYILEKKYQILSVIGSGAFGITYLVKHLTFSSQYVIKEYLPQVAVRDETDGVKPINEQDKELFDWGLKQFIKEAQLLNQLKHPNVVTVIDIFEDNGSAYFVMPYLGKYTLSQWIDDHQNPSVEELYQVFIPLLEGLKYIHDKDLYHSDIKPENILITDNGTPVLIDFGSVRHSSLGGGNDALVLTPPYAPIEQYSSQHELKPSLDLYGLMVCLYEAITKKLIPEAPDRLSHDTLQKLANDKTYQTKYPSYFLSAIDKALSLQSEHRQQSAMILQHELLNYKGEQQSKMMLYSILISIVLVLGGGGYFYYSNHSSVVQLADFTYQTSLPINGEKRAIIELQKSHYNLNVIELDKDKNWKLINSLNFKYTNKPDVLLREMQYQILNFGIKKQINIIVQNDDLTSDNVKPFVENVNFTYGEKSNDVQIHILSEKQKMEYLFTQIVPTLYQHNSLIFYHTDNKSIFVFKDKAGQMKFYNQLDKSVLKNNGLDYIFIIRDKLDTNAQIYQLVKEKTILPQAIKALPLTPILVNGDVGISFLLKNGLTD